MDDPDRRHGLAALALGALGVVYGDIGTSPLYTMKEVFNPANGVPLDAHHIIGAVSVIFWALMVVVSKTAFNCPFARSATRERSR